MGINKANSVSFASGGGVTVSDTAPVSPAAGAEWWDSTSGKRYVYYNDGTSSQWVEGAGASGASGVDAVLALVGYLFDSTTAVADPGSGGLRFDNATFGSITKVVVDDLDMSGVDVSSLIATFDDSTNTVKGHLVVTKSGDAAVYRIFQVDGLTDQSGYTEINVTPLVSGGTLVTSDVVWILFVRAGDAGSFAAVQSIVADTASRSLALTDAGDLLTMDNASERTYTIEQDSTVDFPIGQHIDFMRLGTGSVTIVQGTGATLRAPLGLILRAQYSVATAIKIAANTWVITGDLVVS